MNKFKKMAESYKEKNICIWECSIQYSKLSKMIDDRETIIEILEDEGKKDRIKHLKKEQDQIGEALKGPKWLRQRRQKNE